MNQTCKLKFQTFSEAQCCKMRNCWFWRWFLTRFNFSESAQAKHQDWQMHHFFLLVFWMFSNNPNNFNLFLDFLLTPSVSMCLFIFFQITLILSTHFICKEKTCWSESEDSPTLSQAFPFCRVRVWPYGFPPQFIPPKPVVEAKCLATTNKITRCLIRWKWYNTQSCWVFYPGVF